MLLLHEDISKGLTEISEMVNLNADDNLATIKFHMGKYVGRLWIKTFKANEMHIRIIECPDDYYWVLSKVP